MDDRRIGQCTRLKHCLVTSLLKQLQRARLRGVKGNPFVRHQLEGFFL
jgi:hypothetical protein